MCSLHKPFIVFSHRTISVKALHCFAWWQCLLICLHIHCCLETKGVTQLNIVTDDDGQQADDTMHQSTACRGWCGQAPHTFFPLQDMQKAHNPPFYQSFL